MKTKFTFLCCLAMVWCASLAAQTEFFQDGDMLVCAVLVLPMVRTSLL